MLTSKKLLPRYRFELLLGACPEQLQPVPYCKLHLQREREQQPRLGAFRTVARPSFKEKSAAQIEDVLTGITYIGNLYHQNTNISNI